MAGIYIGCRNLGKWGWMFSRGIMPEQRMSNVDYMMRIERNHDMVNLMGVFLNQVRYALNILLSPRHEQSPVRMTEIKLGVNDQKSIFHGRQSNGQSIT